MSYCRNPEIRNTNKEEKPTRGIRSLKPNKTPGYDNISRNAVNETSGIFFTPFKYIFNFSLLQEIFPENVKIAKMSPIYKKDK